MNRNYELGCKYYNGEDGTIENIEIAIIYFKRALDEKNYEAAYMLGLCFSEGLKEEKRNMNKAIEYMKIADYHYIDDATEWLANYYIKIDFLSFFDHALDLPKYLIRNHTLIINKINSYYETIDMQDHEFIMNQITTFENWWKRIKQPDSKIKKELATKRNCLIRQLCELLKLNSTISEITDEIKTFLKKYYDNFDCVRHSFDASEYMFIMHKIRTAISTSDLEELNERIKLFKDPIISSNLKNNLDNQTVILLAQKENITEQDIHFIKRYASTHKMLTNLISSLYKTIISEIQTAISNTDYDRANLLISFIDKEDPNYFRYKTEINNRIKEAEHAILEEKIKTSYLNNHSQIDFNMYFDLLWSKNDIESILTVMIEAQQHNLSFEYIRHKYHDDFLKNIICRLPKTFFQNDIFLIKKEIERRKIKTLVHFTPISNTQSIVKNGILSKNKLKKNKIEAMYTDENRFDGYLDYISVSITKENAKMFWDKMFNSPVMENGAEIFEIDPSILYECPERIIYCKCNAAKKDAYKYRNYGIHGLKSMFESFDLFPNESNIPTDIQSEILFKGHIDRKYIKNHYTKRFYHG